MKSFGLHLLTLALLVMLVSCGKDNESGKSNMYYNNPLYGGIINPNSPYSVGNISLNTIMNENPCLNNYYGYTNAGGTRQTIQLPAVTVTGGPISGSYVGVTSFGDVAIVQGNGSQAVLTAYLCPRSFAPQGPIQQTIPVKAGAASSCIVPPIVAATLNFGYGQTADFRMLEFGSSMKRPFSFCRTGY